MLQISDQLDQLDQLEESVLNLEQIVHEDNYNEDKNFDETSSPYYEQLCNARQALFEFKIKHR